MKIAVSLMIALVSCTVPGIAEDRAPSAIQGAVQDAMSGEKDSAAVCATKYCQEKVIFDSEDAQKARAVLTKAAGHSVFTLKDIQADIKGPQQTPSGYGCDGAACDLITRKGSSQNKFIGEDAILSTVLGVTAGAFLGGATFDEPGGIGFGILGAILGQRDAAGDDDKLRKRRLRRLEALDRSRANFNDVVFNPAEPIPFDAHFLGDRRGRRDKE